MPISCVRLRHRLRQHAVDARWRRAAARSPAKVPSTISVNRRSATEFEMHAIERGHLDRHVGLGLPHASRTAALERAAWLGLTARSDDGHRVPSAGRRLIGAHENLRLAGANKRAVMHVGHDADDRERRVDRIHAGVPESDADRLRARKIPPHERLVDDRRRWPARPIGVAQGAALHESDADRLEIPGRGDAIPAAYGIAIGTDVDDAPDRRPLRT